MREIIRYFLKEAIANQHFVERLHTRFLDIDKLDVGYELNGTSGIYEVIGTYHLPDELKTSVTSHIDELKHYSFPRNKSFGIKIAEIRIDPKRVEYRSDTAKNSLNGHDLLFVDESTNTNGNVLYAIVRNNEITTVYFGKNYVIQSKEKLNVDVIATMKGIREKKVR